MISKIELFNLTWIDRHAPILLLGAVVVGLSACDPASGNAASTTSPAEADLSTKAQNLGKWNVSEAVNPMTDQKVIQLLVQADDEAVALSIICSKQSAWVHVFWGDFLGGERFDNIGSLEGGQIEVKDVTYRIGEGAPVTEEMLVLDDRTTTQVGDADGFVEKVRTANRLVLQTQPYNKNPKTVVFDTTGLTEVLKAKRPECDWYVRDINRAELAEKRRLAEEDAKKNPPLPTVEVAPAARGPMAMPTEDALAK
ncbi:hypothetical protein AMK06_CH01405 [Rhizobium sp. N541]|uniref:hypothetical protein n=1 Tax=unclassified Rhizobium TaxID=2613769 RepID=UPI0007EE4DA9|nr:MULTISPECIES: hypothetical protein [unclassified Rhizobium]ANM16335.1 hypothetical protein AMK06_CH01405 [Rhizobium sp. N541]ANM22720.1 hypothetical protein AMK07_CH01402 [Rhizobium sp. N941]